MDKNTTAKGFNKGLFCLYQSTSDDLMMWCWFDVLLLRMNYGFSMTQISLLFSVSFWIALAMKLPGRSLAQRLGAGNSVMLSAVLFLTAAVLLTFGRSLPVAIAGQSLYLIAGSFQEMSTVILKNAAKRDPSHVDYVKIMSITGVIFSFISLIASVMMSRLYDISRDLPMYICVGFCINSCVLAFFVRKYDVKGAEEDEKKRREVLPGLRVRSFDKTTVSCLFLFVTFMVIFTVSGDNFKLLIENSLSELEGESRTVFLFSMVLLLSRLAKIVSNFMLYLSRKRNLDPEKGLTLTVVVVAGIFVMGFLSGRVVGYPAVMMVVAAFLLRAMVFDPIRFSLYEFMLRRLKNEKMIDILFIQSVGIDLFTALFSTISTILLKALGLHSVMLMLLLMSLVLAIVYFVIRKNLVRTRGHRGFLQWKPDQTEPLDSLTVAAAALMMHYGLVRDASFTPQKLAEGIPSVEDISASRRGIAFGGIYDYNEKTLTELYNSGHPCAIRAAAAEGQPERWLAVMYCDDDGGVVWNPYASEPFIAGLHAVSKICCFSISGKKGADKNGNKGAEHH